MKFEVGKTYTDTRIINEEGWTNTTYIKVLDRTDTRIKVSINYGKPTYKKIFNNKDGEFIKGDYHYYFRIYLKEVE